MPHICTCRLASLPGIWEGLLTGAGRGQRGLRPVLVVVAVELRLDVALFVLLLVIIIHPAVGELLLVESLPGAHTY